MGVQYSEICQSPSPIIGISSLLPPRPFSTAPGNTGTEGRNEEPAKCAGWLWPAPAIVELLNGFDPNIQSNCFCADPFIRSFFKTDAAFKSPIPAEAILELMPTHHSSSGSMKYRYQYPAIFLFPPGSLFSYKPKGTMPKLFFSE